MSSSQPLILSRIVSPKTFGELQNLWQQMATMAGENSILLASKNRPLETSETQPPLFHLLLSSHLSVLLWGRQLFDPVAYEINITWEISQIQAFISQQSLQLNGEGDRFLTTALSPNNSLFSYLALNLIDILAETQFSLSCQPVEEALHQQIAQERLLNQVVAQIRQSLDLSKILETAVREVRRFLQVDRLVIYQFNQDFAPRNKRSNQFLGKVTYESRVANTIPSMLNLQAEDDCFTHIVHYQKKYRQGIIVDVEDIEIAYSASFCLIKFLQKYWIRAKLIAPIVVEEKLWGLVIAHQCFKKRHWLDSEKAFLGKIGDHLAVAIYQAELYSQVQQQKNNFEQRVIERTQELRDTLLAAQAANQSKTEFLGKMSHELRTPLTCVIGLSGTLLHWSNQKALLPLEKQQQYLRTIQDSGKHLLELINEILEFSQLEAGKLVLEIQPFSLSQLAKQVIQTLQEEAKKQQIKLALDFQVVLQQDSLCADYERLQQILFHLLSNAIKFTPENGKVVLRIWRENHQVIFQVEDTGIGIEEQQLPLLFQTFQQLENYRQRTYGGTGLGLALTKQLVELHQGSIEVESSLNNGSIFTVVIPDQWQNKSKNKHNRLDENCVVSLNNRSVVLIEEDEEIATLMCELLTADNYQVIWLLEGKNCLKTIEVLQPAIIIVDHSLSQIDQIAENLKRSPNTQSIKFLCLSNHISSEDWQKLSRKGVDDYLLKPVTPHLLLQRVGALMLNSNQA